MKCYPLLPNVEENQLQRNLLQNLQQNHLRKANLHLRPQKQNLPVSSSNCSSVINIICERDDFLFYGVANAVSKPVPIIGFV